MIKHPYNDHKMTANQYAKEIVFKYGENAEYWQDATAFGEDSEYWDKLTEAEIRDIDRFVTKHVDRVRKFLGID